MNSNKIVGAFLAVAFISMTGIAAEKSRKAKDKEPAEHHRGWMGGEYKLARRHWSWFDTTDAVVAFPKILTNSHKGILITALTTNTPAYIAGLREADLVLELDHKKIRSLADFRRNIDRAKPGDSLSLCVYRDGEVQDYAVIVGRETFTENGACGLALFFDLPVPNLKFNPSFSLIALGLSREADNRTELGSAEQIFRREISSEHRPSDICWRAWVGPLFAMHTRQIRAQEIVRD